MRQVSCSTVARSTCCRRRTRQAEARSEQAEPCASVRPLLWCPFRHGHGLPVEVGTSVDPPHEGVLEKVVVVAFGVVMRPRVGAATLLARESRDDHALGKLEQEAELERLRQIAVEYL